jgi:hypothetical protein
MRSNGNPCATIFPGGLRRTVRPALWLALFLGIPAALGLSQQSPVIGGTQFPGTSGHGGIPRAQDGGPFSAGPDQYNTLEAEKRARMINAERQKSLVSDTEKLVKLATELNNEIAHSSPSALSAAQVRKVAEIEKLAHNVKDKMIMSVRGPQFNMDPTPPYFPSPTLQ